MGAFNPACAKPQNVSCNWQTQNRQDDDNYKKILFRFHSDVLDEETVETMWAKILDQDKGLFELDSIPFYAPNIASGDIFHASYNEDEQILVYQDTVKFSGNSTVQVVIMDKQVITNDIRDIFNKLGCTSEKFNEGYFVIDVPFNVNYKPIKDKLDELEENGTIGYAEPCLSDVHRQTSSS
jgi:hypothetical protein